MRYVLGTIEALLKTRAALAQLAGYPIKNLPTPPAAEDYSPGAVGWSDQLIGEPFDTPEGGLMQMPSDVDPYLGQSAAVDGETITVPTEDELLAYSELPDSYKDWLWARQHPPDFYPGGPPPRPMEDAPLPQS